MTKSEALANLGGGFIQNGADAKQRPVESKLKDMVSVLDFIPESEHDSIRKNTSTYNATAAINNALSASNYVFFPAGTYLTDGNHNIQEKSLFGVDKYLSKIQLTGSNTNDSVFINSADISTPWGSGGGCRLEKLSILGNCPKPNLNPNSETDISNIGALFKWWSGAGVEIVQCSFLYSFGFGIFCYRLGYSYINQTEVLVSGKNGIHLEAATASAAVTSTSISDCRSGACYGQEFDADTGGSGLCIINGFQVKVYNSTFEGLSDGIRLGGIGNRSNVFIGNHTETCNNAGFNYVGTGFNLLILNNILGNGILGVNTSKFTEATVLGNQTPTDTDVINLPKLKSTGEVDISSVAPKAIIAEVTLTPGTWQLTGNWTGLHSSGSGTVSAAQAYTINTSASIPGYDNSFDKAVLSGELASPSNQFNPLQGTLSLSATVTSDTTYYLYGGPSSVTGDLTCKLAGTLQATKVSVPYYLT